MNPQLTPPKYTEPVVADFDMQPSTMQPVVACVWWNATGKYPFEYVKRLKRAVDRNMTLDYQFYCFTDQAGDYWEMMQELGIIPLQCVPGIEGWWQKIYLFDRQLWSEDERILMLDLDCVITGSLDNFFFSTHHTTAIANFGVNYRHSKYNSSVVCWDSQGPAGKVYTDFERAGPRRVIKALHGDQCFFWRSMVDDVRVWPKDWCLSYKYDVRRGGLRHNTKAVIFHGKPDPHEVRDPFVKANWGEPF